MFKRFSIIGSVVGTAISLSASAQGTGVGADGRAINTITTAVPFLRISPDARSGGMGDVGIAMSPDANAQFWNIGKLPFATKNYGVALTYTPWLKDLVPDIFLAYISGYAKFGKEGAYQTVSGSLRYFSLGDITYTQDGINPTGTGKPREFALDLGYARQLSPYLSTGVSLRYIHSAIASGLAGTPGADYAPGNTVAGDVGIYYTKTKELDDFRKNNFSFGAVISNLGGKISYSSVRKDFIPINLGIGAAYTSQFDEYNKVTFAIDINKLLVPTPLLDTSGKYFYPTDKTVVSGVLGSFGDAPGGGSEELREINFSAGAEYWYQDQFAVRAGYFYEDKTKGDRKYFTVGLGAKYNIFTLNASYLVPSGAGISRNPLSNTLRFTLSFDFDKVSGNSDAATSDTPASPQ